MYVYLLRAISCLCILSIGIGAEECSQAVLNRRESFYVPVGGSLSLSCVVQHCGDPWNGTWIWRNSTVDKFSIVESTAHHHLTSLHLSDNQTRLVLSFPSVSQLDEGSYGCNVKWHEGESDQGHLQYVNITAALSSHRPMLHRVLVCVAASLCFPIILGLAHCLSSEVKSQPHPRIQNILVTEPVVVHRDRQYLMAPHPPPRRPVPQKHSSASSKRAPLKRQQRPEVVYADLSQDALRQQAATREPPQSTVYTSVRFT
ncbi:uncharacterized protein LOC115431590 [Sphaeramia orbicularis]|uniref:Uncharacterized LOC115431590 n=1 Tax=Sphaeramia orbicularis TaxID=375764 RepID=A0A673B9Z5_9TELE|nr:uncharacterized protein LOC115431590 [Sphaeramia orbicularis]